MPTSSASAGGLAAALAAARHGCRIWWWVATGIWEHKEDEGRVRVACWRRRPLALGFCGGGGSGARRRGQGGVE